MPNSWRSVPKHGLADAPRSGALTALSFVLIMGRADRFQCSKQIASYLGRVPLERTNRPAMFIAYSLYKECHLPRYVTNINPMFSICCMYGARCYSSNVDSGVRVAWCPNQI
jgi:hypothetical protein